MEEKNEYARNRDSLALSGVFFLLLCLLRVLLPARIVHKHGKIPSSVASFSFCTCIAVALAPSSNLWLILRAVAMSWTLAYIRTRFGTPTTATRRHQLEKKKTKISRATLYTRLRVRHLKLYKFSASNDIHLSQSFRIENKDYFKQEFQKTGEKNSTRIFSP